MNKKKKKVILILSVILAIILALVGAFFIITHIGKNQFHKDDAHISAKEVEIEDENTITYKGKEYTLNKNIASVLVMGIDRSNINENFGSGNNGQADVIFVATVDTKTKKISIIPISRETMVDVNLYTVEGKFAGTKNEQLCLAYAYGNSAEESSENVMRSVKRLLYNININSYVTIEMEGIEKLTDMVGGIDVVCLEDFVGSKINYKKGQNLTLTSQNVNKYILYRGDDIEANSRRMQRQKQFLSALLNKTGNMVVKDFTKLPMFYKDLSPYYNTNISFPQVAYLAQNCLTTNIGDSLNYKTIDGKLVQGEKWVEFYADEESLLQTVIDVFYLPKE